MDLGIVVFVVGFPKEILGNESRKRFEPRPDPLRTASPTEGGSRLQASLADPKGGLDGSVRFTPVSDGFSMIFSVIGV